MHEWSLARVEEGKSRTVDSLRIEEFMTTDLFTVHPEEPVDLVSRGQNQIMPVSRWPHIIKVKGG